MKPRQGSTRSPKKAGKKPAVKRNMKPKEDQANAKLKPAQKRKAKGGSSPPPKKVKGQDNWRPMSRPSITALENILDLAILTTITLKRMPKSLSQEHLIKIKKGFLAECLANIRVPPQKRSNLEYSSHQYQEETKKSKEGRKSLNSLEEDLKNVVKALEKLEQQNETLQHQCSVLRDQVEEEEEKAKQMEESTLKARMREILPDSDSEHLAQKLGEILQKSETSNDEQALLLQAQKQADQLFGPAIGLNRALQSS
ncbi:centromere protein Q isoform X2 [Gouania willdenowi]|uniref:centromere protein Q isoform X2 n=1 Tax=Gouania willdenowi TaxID=441366 RepID=UPI001054EDC1|nr:centromere protein Q-like isoform X2 [Gouania willdenowi]